MWRWAFLPSPGIFENRPEAALRSSAVPGGVSVVFPRIPERRQVRTVPGLWPSTLFSSTGAKSQRFYQGSGSVVRRSIQWGFEDSGDPLTPRGAAEPGRNLLGVRRRTRGWPTTSCSMPPGSLSPHQRPPASRACSVPLRSSTASQRGERHDVAYPRPRPDADEAHGVRRLLWRDGRAQQDVPVSSVRSFQLLTEVTLATLRSFSTTSRRGSMYAFDQGA